MKRNAFLASTYGAVVALGLMSFGCSSTSNSGTGGATGSAGSAGSGAGGHVNGTGGSTTAGTGGSTGQGGAKADAGTDGPMTCASPAPVDGTQCSNNPPCNKNCGVNIMALTTSRAQKTCTCSTTWACGACVYPTDVNLDCLRLPTPVPECPHDPADGGTTALIKPGVTPCTPPNSEVCGNVCGSATAGTFSYQDSTGTGKVGYCACISGAYQCASVAEWPAL
jgi:hypothetical protein